MEYVDQRKCIGFVRTSPKQQQITEVNAAQWYSSLQCLTHNSN